MLTETFEISREEILSQRASYLEISVHMGQRNVDRLFLTFGKVAKYVFTVVFWLLLAIIVLEPLLAWFVGDPYSPRTLLMSLPTFVILRLLIQASKHSMGVNSAFLTPIRLLKFKALLKQFPVTVTWKLDNDTLDYKGKTKHLIFRAEHLRGQGIPRVKNWIGLRWGLTPVVLTLGSEDLAIQLQTELRRIAGEPAVPLPEKRVNLLALLLALLVSLAALRLL